MKVVFVSGPHGSGKSTLIETITREDPRFKRVNFDVNFLKSCKTITSMTVFESCLLRLYHRFFTAEYAMQHQGSNEEVLIVDRGIYDSVAYIETEKNAGMLSDEEYCQLHRMYELALKIINPRTILLNPEVDVIMKRLTSRRKSGDREERNKIADREDSYEYVSSVREEIEKLQAYDNTFLIRDNDENSINAIKEWLNIGK